MRFFQGTKDFAIEQLVAKFADSTLVTFVLPWTTRTDIEGLDATLAQPSPYRVGSELRSVVRTNMIGQPITDEELGQAVWHMY